MGSRIKKQYVGHLMQEHLKRYPQSKVRERKNCFESFCNQFLRFDIHQVDQAALKGWFDGLKDEFKYTKPTMIKVKASLNHFFIDMVKQNVISENPMSGIKFKGVHKITRERTVLSPDEISQMLEEMKLHSPEILYPYIFVLAHTGARLGEIRTLKWKWINFKLNEILIPHTKNGKERRLPMSPTLSDFMKGLFEMKRDDSEWVFLNQRGTLLSAGQIRDTIISYQNRFEVEKKWTPHDLRHSFAHNYLKKGGLMHALQALLGHKRITMTVDYYGQIQASDVKMVSPYD